jgi:hypothetical protein
MNKNYPVIGSKDAQTIGGAVEAHRNRTGNYAGFDEKEFEGLIKTRVCRDSFDSDALAALAREFQATRSAIQGAGGSASAKKNEQEEEFAQLAVRLIELLPLEASQDPDFWRYLSVFIFRDYICAVEGDFEPQRYGGNGNKSLVRWTLIRGLVWGLHCAKGDDLSGVYRARLVREAAGKGSEVRDLYISHVIRPNWAKSKGAGLAFIDAAMAEPPLFDVGKVFRPWQQLNARVGRVAKNIYLPSLSQDELESLILQEREGIPTEPSLGITS